jgi:energy-coupling factor transport system permease protein
MVHMKRREAALDPRAWAVWAFAAGASALLGRNPWPLITVAIAVVAVRIAWRAWMTGGGSWTSYLKLTMLFAAFSTLFNVLTVRAGEHTIARLPDWLPLVGGELTLNAAVYGLLSGAAIVLLVMIGTTFAALVDWAAVVRLIPESLASMAVAGSIAFTFLPQTATAFRDIREAQAARGHRVRGARDLLPILIPVLGSGLERAITLAESLESRGFGGSPVVVTSARHWARYAGAAGLSAATVGVYLMVTGNNRGGLLAGSVIVGSLAVVVWSARQTPPRRTRYRPTVWTARETAVVAGAAAALAITIWTLEVAPSAVRYEPYPRLTTPSVNLLLVAGLLGLLVPAWVAPAGRELEAPE